MANEGSTKPTYSELEAELLRVRGLLQRLYDNLGAYRDETAQQVRQVIKPILTDPKVTYSTDSAHAAQEKE